MLKECNRTEKYNLEEGNTIAGLEGMTSQEMGMATCNKNNSSC